MGTIPIDYNRKGGFPSLGDLLLVSFFWEHQLLGSEIDQKQLSGWGKDVLARKQV